MKEKSNTWRCRLTIKNRIILSSALLVLIVVLSNLYSYFSNGRVITQQDRLNGQRLQVLLQLETISKYVALAELESRSYLLIEKEEFNKLRRRIWDDKINPAAVVLRYKIEEDKTNTYQKDVIQLLTDLITFQRLQERTEINIRSLFAEMQKQDSTVGYEYKSKIEMALKINQYQRPVFDAIKEGSEKLIQQQRELIHTESDILSHGMRIGQFITLGLIVGSLGLSILLVYSLVKVTIHPLLKVSDYLSKVALGTQPDQMKEPENEMGVMINSINRLVTHLKAYANFSSQVGMGKYNNQLTPASASDTLGNALLIMQEKLREAENDGKRRNWVAEGIAKFAALLRDHTVDKHALGTEIINFLVRYFKANQGGVFILRGDSANQYLELEACYAYGRKKFIQKTINLGEGLVGQAVLEAETIYLKKVPKDYMRITSGLGEAAPSTVVIVPLKSNEKVYGAIEIASFGPFAQYEIALLEKLAESAASAIAESQLHVQTEKLLIESQQKAEELRAQEEEMRQNMEELMATQEAEARRIKELEQMNVKWAEQQQMLTKNKEKLMKQENEIFKYQAEITWSRKEVERLVQISEKQKQENYELVLKLEAVEKRASKLQ